MAEGELTQTAPGLPFARTEEGSAPADLAAPSIPASDRFTVIRLLGQGGMGAVYEARDLRLDRVVALKLILGAEPRHTRRLLQEARAQARVDHPNVCKVFEVGEISGKAYIAMELVDGVPLGELAPHLALHDKVQVVRDVALALHEAHKIGILHRDVKPSNILVETGDDGRLRPIVMDFGIARDEGAEQGLTETGALVGTPAYMSPEQARGGRGLDRRSDVYSLGATLYDLLAGRPPFAGDSVMKIVLAVLQEEPVPLRTRVASVPEDLETIAAKCLSKEPGQRYDSAKALAEDLDRWIHGEPILGRREGLLRRARRWARRNKALVATAAAALLAVGVSGGLGVRGRILASRQAAALEAEARMGRELGQDVKDMEWLLRVAHLMPLHDVTRERALVEARMKRIAERPAPTPAAAALVDYALGRGHLALGQDAEARERLSHAAALGLDTPELHYALGLVLGRLYQQALAVARRGGDRTWVERRAKELDAEYLRPALASMQKSRSAPLAAPSYLDGLVAFYEKDYEAALRLAQKARLEAPWVYEATELAADVHLGRGIERKDRGENEGAERDLEDAARLFDEAAEMGRSDATLYEGGAEAWIRRMEMAVSRGVSPREKQGRALERCERAAKARPDRAAPYLQMAQAHGFLGGYLGNTGEDPRPAFALALDAAERARAMTDASGEPHERQADAWAMIAGWELAHGLDPLRALTATVENGERAVARDPRHPWAWVALGNGLGLRGMRAMSVGADPESDLRRSIDAYAKSTEIDEGYAIGHASALFTYTHLVRWLAVGGHDAAREEEEAARRFAACTRANPTESQCYENMGILELRAAEIDRLAGRDPRGALKRAEEQLRKSESLMKDYVENHQSLAEVYLLHAADAVGRGDDAAGALASLGDELATCARLDAKNPVCAMLDARRALLLADVEATRGKPGQATLDRAHAAALAAVEQGPRDADTYEVLAETERRLAVAAPEAERAKHLAAELAACERGLAVNPNHARLLATKGALLLLDARDAGGARRALDALRRALELSPPLRRELGPLLTDAERRAAAP